MKAFILSLISLILISCDTPEEKMNKAAKENIDYQSSLTVQDLIDFLENKRK